MRELKFIIDENADQGVGAVLAGREHTVWYVTDVMGEKSDDEEIVAWAMRDYAIIVTRNRKHFQPSANNARRGRASDPPRHWGLLLLDCDEPEEERRVRELADAIGQEAHYAASRYPKGFAPLHACT